MTWREVLRRSDSAAGPFEAWLTPRLELTVRPSAEPIDMAEAKLGGQPVWLDTPFWPLSATSGTPMVFIGQFPLPAPSTGMCYLFMAEDSEGTGLTFEPEAGDNALLVQPGGRVPPFLKGTATATGPTLWRRGQSWEEQVPVELRLEARPVAEPAQRAFEAEVAWQAAARNGEVASSDHLEGVESRSHIGGPPLVWQPWTTAIGRSWRFFFQLDGGEGSKGEPYALNFGGGTGYAFLSEDELEGRFLWDCV